MKRNLTILIFAVVALILFTGLAGAQSLLNNPDFKKAQDLQAKAQAALAAGDYDQAAAYAEQAKQAAQKSQDYVDMMVLRYKANGWIKVAQNRLVDAKQMGAEERYPDEWKQASDNYANAQVAFQDAKYPDSIEYSKNVIAWLQNVQPPPPEEKPVPVEKPVEKPKVAVKEGPVFPKYYVVRLIPEDRDCFNKITGYPFVYNDRYKWRILYEANKEKLRHPNNPHLIHPGQVFIIPSIQGETREGTWDPNQEYPVFGK
jgi:nucleoid-associated protein YgaU